MSATARSPSAAASARPSVPSLMSPSVIPAALRMSNTGAEGDRNAAELNTGRSGVWLMLNGMTVGECVWITARTSGRTL